MIEWLSTWSLFSAKALTLLVLLLIFFAMLIALVARARSGGSREDPGYLSIISLNETYEDYDDAFNVRILSEAELKARDNSEKRKRKAEEKTKARALKSKQRKGGEQSTEREKVVFVIDFEGDVEASEVDQLRRLITAVVRNAKAGDEVVLRLDSPGGSVTGYGLGASQLERLRKAGITLVVCVDQVAASGGYMMATVANRILAAPFAVVGSIGVVTEIPNVHRLLEKHDIDYDVYTAGVNKRPVSVFGENTKEGVEKLKTDLAVIHDAFKKHVIEYRRNLDMDVIGTGDIWLGENALSLGLVDEIKTSDDYLLSLGESCKLLELKFVTPKSLGERLGMNSATALRALTRMFRSQSARLGLTQ